MPNSEKHQPLVIFYCKLLQTFILKVSHRDMMAKWLRCRTHSVTQGSNTSAATGHLRFRSEQPA